MFVVCLANRSDIVLRQQGLGYSTAHGLGGLGESGWEKGVVNSEGLGEGGGGRYKQENLRTRDMRRAMKKKTKTEDNEK